MALKNKLVISVIFFGFAVTGIVFAAAEPTPPTFNATTTYKTKCTACHGAKAQKAFDATKSDDDLVQAILKGKKAPKPPNMPAYETKGINAENAKALVEHMKHLKQ